MKEHSFTSAILDVFRKGNTRWNNAVRWGYDPDFKLYSEFFFHEILSREKRRVDRSGKALFLLMLDIHQLFGIISDKNLADRLSHWMELSVRESDIKGWFKNRHTVGIIYTEVLKSGKEPVLRKCRELLSFEFGQELVQSINLTFSIFPEECHDAAGQLPDENMSNRAVPSRESMSRKAAIIAKRAIDIAGSLSLMLLLTPLFLLIAGCIKWTSPGPAFFVQQRVGEGGNLFRFIKFRTMYQNADSEIHKKYVFELIKNGGAAVDEGPAPVYKLVNDPRVTTIGRFLRNTSLDELPQLFNVLKGDMSLVGPRPALPYEIENYRRWHLRRVFGVKPGMTGIWQVEGRSRTPFETMVRMDLRYIQKWSLLLDFKLLFKTVFAMYRGGY